MSRILTLTTVNVRSAISRTAQVVANHHHKEHVVVSPPRSEEGFVDHGQREGGVIIVLVIFIVALASILVVNLSYSTILESKSLGLVARQLQAEYALKSAMSFAQALLAQDTSRSVDAYQDPWGVFVPGIEIPEEFKKSLGFDDPSMRIFLEISPQSGKLPLNQLAASGSKTIQARWRDVLSRLNKNLGFDNDSAPDHLKLFPGRTFGAEEMVANLIDFIDRDNDSYQDANFAAGIESQINSKELFKNEKLTRVEELLRVPGFAPSRVRDLSAYVHTLGESQVNINIASKTVIEALHDEITSDIATSIVEYAQSEEGPFEGGNLSAKIDEFVPGIQSEIRPLIKTNSTWFQVIAKVEYGSQSAFFMKGFLVKGSDGELPELRYPVLY